jgi:hypothetical protein
LGKRPLRLLNHSARNLVHLRIDSLGTRFAGWKISTRGGERWAVAPTDSSSTVVQSSLPKRFFG